MIDMEDIYAELFDEKAVQGIIISSTDGIPINYLFKGRKPRNIDRLAAALTSMVFISKEASHKLLHRRLKFTISYGKDQTLIATAADQAIVCAFLSRKLMGFHPIDHYTKIVQEAALKASAVLTSKESPKGAFLVKVRQMIPEVIGVAFLTHQGKPISAETDYDLHQFTAMISGIFGSALPLTKEPYTQIVAAKNHLILIMRVDDDRLLAVVTPEEHPIDEYITKLQHVIKDSYHNQKKRRSKTRKL